MRKRVIACIIGVVIVAISISCYFIFRNTEKNIEGDNATSKSLSYELLTAKSVGEIDNIVSEFDLNDNAEKEEGYYSVYDVDYHGFPAEYSYVTNEGTIDKAFCNLLIYGYDEGENGELILQEYTKEELQEKIKIIIESFGKEIFDLSYVEDFDIIGSDGVACDKTIDSYYKIGVGEAKLRLRIKNSDGSLWVLQIFLDEEYGTMMGNITHYFNSNDFDGIIPNITIN